MTLQTNLTNFATRLATEFKAVRTLLAGTAGDLASLSTTAKGNLVAAINELDAALEAVAEGAAGIDDASIGTTSTWSSSKTATEIAALISDAAGATDVDKTWSADKIVAAIAAAKSELVNGAGSALDTLKELADALGDDENFSTTVNTAIANRLRVDAPQSLTTEQKSQACTNLGLGEPETDLVAVFNAGLV